jgi:hypothetical protein
VFSLILPFLANRFCFRSVHFINFFYSWVQFRQNLDTQKMKKKARPGGWDGEGNPEGKAATAAITINGNQKTYKGGEGSTTFELIQHF